MEDTTAPSRNSKGPKRPLIVLLVLSLLGVVLFFAARPSAPGKISVRYLGRIDRRGPTRLRFGIQNVGTSRVFPTSIMTIEVRGTSNRFQFWAQNSLDRLDPGEEMWAECILWTNAAATVGTPWRVSCYYAGNEIHSWIWWWQWRPGGPGIKANGIVPHILQGIHLSVMGTSTWNEPLLPLPDIPAVPVK